MRYGKYCGVSYTGCPGEAPCDALDACCMLHDACVQATDSTCLIGTSNIFYSTLGIKLSDSSHVSSRRLPQHVV